MDTGGISRLSPSKEDGKKKFNAEIKKQTLSAIKKAELIIFLVDLQDGLMPQDRQMAADIKKLKKPIIFVGNKADSRKLRDRIIDTEWLKLGLGFPAPISAAGGNGTGDLLDAVMEFIKAEDHKERESELLKLAIVGKPNVGKSSMLNCLVGEERAIISPIAHTTREPQDTALKYKGQDFLIIDTAGIARKRSREDKLQKEGVMKSLSTLKKADVCVLTIDISRSLTVQDANLAGEIIEADCGVIIAANKWDLIEEKTTSSTDEFIKYIHSKLPFLTWAPIVFTSAAEKQRVRKILDLALEIKEARKKELSESQLEKFIKSAVKKHRPAKAKGIKRPFIRSIRQTGSNPPRFTVTVGKEETLHFSYIRYIENQLRERFGFLGTSIKINVENK